MATHANGKNMVAAQATRIAVRDWLETQAKVTQYWRELLVASGECEDLIQTLDQHAAFLQDAVFDDAAVYSSLQ